MPTQHSLESLASDKTEISSKEQPRRTASLLQPDDPRIYYYLAWTSPPAL